MSNLKGTIWSPSIDLRILIREGKRVLQQRWTRIVLEGDGTKIEEKWTDVPVVNETRAEQLNREWAETESILGFLQALPG